MQPLEIISTGHRTARYDLEDTLSMVYIHNEYFYGILAFALLL